MHTAAQRLLTDALELSDDDREALGWALLDTVRDAEDHDAVETAWRAEARARLANLREGRAAAAPWNEVEARLRALVRAR